MTQPGLIDRQGLLQWGNSIGADSDLPRLLRRLILETGRGVVHLEFPGGEGVAGGGWDGVVRATEEAPYISQGLSLWEVSVNGNPGAKADKDYTKRTTTPDGSPTTESTYVEVVLRAWTRRADWARDRAAEGRWKAVRALGVDEVEIWLESAPITHAWLSELVGLHPHGLETAETWWRRWSLATTPAFPTAAVIAGRDEAMIALRDALAQPGEIVTIRGSSRDEVAAFVSSLALAEEITDGGALLARTALVDNVETWRRLRSHPTPLVLVALTEQVIAEFAPGTRHVLIVPRTGTSDADIVLPQIDAQAATKILASEGLPERLAKEAGQLARLSLLAARRRLANKRELLQPAWAETPASKPTRRLALIGRWSENSDADCTLVEKMVGVPYDTLREEIAALVAGGDPLLARVSSAVGVVSPIDAWLLLCGELRRDDFESFHDTARTVLAEIDPRLDLSREDRWLAQVHGKKPSYSADVRQGYATTLALLGAYGHRPIVGTSITGREWAVWLVRETLAAANADATCRLWSSLADTLPLLAEAAPQEFLDAVAAGVSGQSPVLSGMFEDASDNGNPLASDSAHSSLLWAIEACAWSPIHFGHVIDVLARLTEIDPDGRLANRPFASLRAILLPWHPQTSVSAEQRLAAIDGLRERHAAVAWKLLLSLLPEMHSVVLPINEPQFRDWKPEQITVTNQEYWTVIGEICTRLLTDASHNPDRWTALIGKIDNIPQPDRATTLARLDELSRDADLSVTQRTAIWEALRVEAAKHREFATTTWALPADEVSAMEAAAARLAPTDPAERYRWLFKQQSPMISAVRQTDDFAAYDAEVTKLRASAAAEIANATDWSGLQRFAMSLEHPWIVGQAMAQAQRYEHENEFLAFLGSTERQDVIFAAGYVSERFRVDGWDWIDSHLNGGALSSDQIARLLLYTDDYPRAWEVAGTMSEPITALFWQQFRTHGLGAGFVPVDFVAKRLLDANRPDAALDLIMIYSDHKKVMELARAEFVARGLEVLLERDGKEAEISALGHYAFVELFNALERSELPRERLAWLEWAYLPFLVINGRPAALTAMLSRDPDFFVDIIRHVFKPNGHKESEGSETATQAEDEASDVAKQVAIATNGYSLLMEWKDIPGKLSDGTVDSAALDAWVMSVRPKLRESGHLEVGDLRIGHVLAWGPTDADGSRPCLAVRNLLEKLESPDIEDGLIVELRNSRGVTTRGVFDGGDQERLLAADYSEQAKKFADRWPRTATLLRKVGESYAQYARMMDEDAERRRTSFGA